MTRLLFSLFISFLLFSSLGLKAQIDSANYYARKDAAQKSYDNYKEKALVFDQQMHSIDSIYKAGLHLYETSENTFRRAKKAFKSMEINYKAQILPYQKKSTSKDRKEVSEARRMLQIIKTRFQANGRKTAEVANDASRNMLRAEKIMERAEARSELLIPRYKKILDEMDVWEKILLEMEER
jgi:hypothetical protein